MQRQACSTTHRHSHRAITAGIYMAVVTNCTPWTYLGDHPISPTPLASFDEGLDVYARTRFGLASVLLGTFRMARGTAKAWQARCIPTKGRS